MGQRDRDVDGSRHLKQALAAVEAMDAIDAVAVPATPSPSMMAAGALTGDVSKETAARIYRAMIQAGSR